MRKVIGLFVVGCCFTSTLALSAEGINLVCRGPYEDPSIVHLSGGGTERLSTDLIFPLHAEQSYIARTYDGDCKFHAKRNLCYEDGQLMVNVPKKLSPEPGSVVKVWINLDTDDITDHYSIGDVFTCTVVK